MKQVIRLGLWLVISFICVNLFGLDTINSNNDVTSSPKNNQKSLIKNTFVFVDGGQFSMGCDECDSDSDEVPIHKVEVEDFYIGKYEVTQKEYLLIMGENPTYKFGVGDNYPVYFVNWYDAVEYCNCRSQKEGLEKCYQIDNHTVTCDFSKNGYRLPTEEEWEYAARGGKLSKSYKYSGSNNIDEVAAYCNNCSSTLHEVGTLKANELGIYDMSGNVYEWVWDYYYYYLPNDLDKNIIKSKTNYSSFKLNRGGSWTSNDKSSRISNRNFNCPLMGKYNDLGFRVVRSKI